MKLCLKQLNKEISYNQVKKLSTEKRILDIPELNDYNILKNLVCIRPSRQQNFKLGVESLEKKVYAESYGLGGSGWTIGPGCASYLVRAILNTLREQHFNTDQHGGTQHIAQEFYLQQKQFNNNTIGTQLHLDEKVRNKTQQLQQKQQSYQNQQQPKYDQSEIGDVSKVKVSIVGGGCMGMFTALEMVRLGFRDIEIVAKDFENITSFYAAGLFATSTIEYEESMAPLVDQLVLYSWDFYSRIILKQHPLITNHHTRFVSKYGPIATDSDMDMLERLGLVKPKVVVVDFQNGLEREMKVYDDTLYMDTWSLMVDMRTLLKQKFKVNFIQREVQNLREEFSESKVVVNCSGLGAKQLSQDEKVYPVQGHLILLKNQSKAQNLNYMLEFESQEIQVGQFKGKTKFQFMPKRMVGAGQSDVGVIGGNYISGADHDNPHLDQFDRILQQARMSLGRKLQITQL